MAIRKISLRGTTPYKRTIKNPVTNENANDKIYTVMDNSRKLSEQKIITKTSGGGEPLQDSLAILSAFGISVVEEVEETKISLLSKKYLQSDRLEKLTKTQDNNPNRPEIKKFKNLKNKKVAASVIFNQTTNNSINDLDSCQTNDMKVKKKPLSHVIEIADDFIKSSPLPLTKRLVLK